jgi:hypothetical protein
MSKIIISLCAFVILAVTPSVRADTVVITSGSVTLQGAFGGISYSLAGQNFLISGSGDGGFSAARNCTPCLAGSSLGTFTVVTGNGLGSGFVTINGTTFINVIFRGTLELSGGSFTVPNTLSNVTLTSGASLSASIFGCQGPFGPCDESNAIFTTTLLGNGTATLRLIPSGLSANGTPLFFFSSLVFDFGPTREVPEPMTITLLASGLAGVGAKLGLRTTKRPK